jgi:hypothetical protein
MSRFTTQLSRVVVKADLADPMVFHDDDARRDDAQPEE